MKWNILLLFVLLFAITGCEKTLQLNLAAGEAKLVVEGNIEKNNFPFIVLTKSVGFSEAIDISKVQFVEGGKVLLADVTTKDTINLREYIVDTSFNNQTFRFIVHSIDFANPNHINFIGKTNHQYFVSIDALGKKHNGYTNCPNSVQPDSIWLKPILNSKDSAMLVNVRWDDPDTIGNYIRYETRVLRKNKTLGLDENWLTDFTSVFDDKFTNGKKLVFELELGYNKSQQFGDSANNAKFNKQRSVFAGDTVILKFGGIDYNTYEYWRTLEFSRNSTGNPFAAPTRLKSNLSNDAVGIFGAYNTLYDTIIAK